MDSCILVSSPQLKLWVLVTENQAFETTLSGGDILKLNFHCFHVDRKNAENTDITAQTCMCLLQVYVCVMNVLGLNMIQVRFVLLLHPHVDEPEYDMHCTVPESTAPTLQITLNGDF